MAKLVPKKQTAWGKLEYNGPQYSQVIELMKREDPQAYNRLLVANARSLQPGSEVIIWTDAKGNERTSTTNIGMSGTDPVGVAYVGDVLLSPAFKLAGRGILWGLAKSGNNWARAKILSREMLNISTPNKAIPNNVGWAPKQTIQVSHARNRNEVPDLYFEKRWDVVNEGANPHGIWYQGKLGIPRTDLTNPGKGAKALKARDLFANRKYHLNGEVTFEKPIQTIGDVKDRSRLSYDADNMGADGLIYNDIYDNGYNHNLVILGWKLFDTKLGNPSQLFILNSKDDILNALRNPLWEYHNSIVEDLLNKNKLTRDKAILIFKGIHPGTAEARITPITEIDDETYKIIGNQVFKRLYNKRSVNKKLDKVYLNIYIGTDKLFNAYNPNSYGVSINNGNIVLREGYPRAENLPHEIRHRIKFNKIFHKNLIATLNKAYGDDFNNDEIKSMLGLDESYNLDIEKATTNLDARINLLKNKSPKAYYKYNLLKQNDVINKASDDMIIEAVSNSNGYGGAYIKYLQDNNLLTKDKIKAFRNAMIKVGGLSAPVIVDTELK